MKEIISLKGLQTFSMPFLFMLSLICLTVMPVTADAESSGNAIDMARDSVIRHMNIMRQKFPEIDEKVRQTEEELSSGAMSPLRACSNCHIQE